MNDAEATIEETEIESNEPDDIEGLEDEADKGEVTDTTSTND